MASKRGIRRRLANKACIGKQKHTTQAEAVAHKIRHQRDHPADWNMKTYRCRHCGGWHLGHFRPR